MSISKDIFEFDAVVKKDKTVSVPTSVPDGMAHFVMTIPKEKPANSHAILELLDRWEKELHPDEPRRTKEEIDNYLRTMRDELE